MPVAADGMPTPETAAAEPPAKKKPACGSSGEVFLKTFVSAWIAAEHNRPSRVAIIRAILEAAKTDSVLEGCNWDEAYLHAKMKKLAAKQRRVVG